MDPELSGHGSWEGRGPGSTGGQQGGGWYFLPTAPLSPRRCELSAHEGTQRRLPLRHTETESPSRIVLCKRESEVAVIAGADGLRSAWLRSALCTPVRPMRPPHEGGTVSLPGLHVGVPAPKLRS